MRDFLDGFVSFLGDRRLLVGYFVFCSFLMLWQHSMGWAWDFSVYSLNAEYLFHDGVYMEWKRPPLLSSILGVLQYVFSVRGAEYVFIVLNSVLFFFASLRFSEGFDLDALYFYVFVMSPFVVFYSVLQGTELLFLSFVVLMVSDLDSPLSGFWLGLAFLSRYTAALYALLFIFQKDLWKMVKSGLLTGLTVLPWLAASYLFLGHPFASVADSYALDVVERGLVTPFKWSDVLLMTGFTLPFALNYFKEKSFVFSDFLMGAVSVLVTLRQFGTQVKVRRYLFDLSLPAAFFAAKGLNSFDNPKKLLYIVMALSVVGSSFLMVAASDLDSPGVYEDAASEVGECKSVSNKWPMLSYAGTPTGPLETQFNSTEDYIESGYKVVVFENNSYTVRGSGCIRESFDSTYLDRLGSVYGARVCGYLPVYNCGLEDALRGVLK